MRTMKEKMHTGEIYLPGDEEILEVQFQWLDRLYDYNMTRPTEGGKRQAMLKEMFAEIGENCYIEPPLHANQGGAFVHFGKNIYANFNLTLVDDTHIYVGDYTMFGPNVTLATAGHPILPALRGAYGYQYNMPVHIGKNCWLGAGVVVLPGVTVGDNTVIGAGSIVTKDIPSDVVAVGNPCRVVRKINEHDREYYYKDRKIPKDIKSIYDQRVYDIFFFDLDGTLTDSSPGITNSVIYALKKFGIEETDRTKLYPFIGPPLTESFARFYGFSEERCMEAVRYYREYYSDKGIFQNSVYDGLEDVLKELKRRGKKLVVATSKPEPFARRIIEHFDLAQYFDYVAGMELNGGRGTKEDVIRYALDTCKVTDKDKVLMVGDREHDVLGAKGAGIDCLGILYGFGTSEELERAGADYIEETVEGILRFA